MRLSESARTEVPLRVKDMQYTRSMKSLDAKTWFISAIKVSGGDFTGLHKV
jgi:hypothetical protein